MKRVIYSSKRYATKPIDLLKSKLGISWGSNANVYPVNEGKFNFKLSSRYDRLTKDSEFFDELKKAGAKYITPKWGDIYFYFDMSDLENQYKDTQAQYDREYDDELNAMDIDQYRPDAKTLQKLADYRAKGSKVNVKAIKDDAKALTYYYGACLLGWEDLKYDCSHRLGYGYSDVIAAIARRVKAEEDLADDRDQDDIALGIPNSNGLFKFESRTKKGDPSCWLPTPVFKMFIDEDVPVNFGKRTSGGRYDRNGAEWSEIEHLELLGDAGQEKNIDIVVHTNERADNSIPKTYTIIDADRGYELGSRVSARQLLATLKEVVNDLKA